MICSDNFYVHHIKKDSYLLQPTIVRWAWVNFDANVDCYPAKFVVYIGLILLTLFGLRGSKLAVTVRNRLFLLRN